uniref:protein-tyrosine-phosphatase n=1 Tax=Mucochytrium quahogii TaxID=96639 RepID=A0A7S2R809_9STRA|mmetsp:Transcript_14802/g.24082  ORF Transcript_14802/g.24082 Transcript_14802/m.24082 type:complete len:182 (+) Transcript_14802:442-987(+)|eukprot:CAMPEP_0203757696 /NCGR_PEP_ID=MMETSP0098-20131031/10639_1 /ASSEMBLY_ACC=CAM_ASM_000208 /TAXON_ID=96639 /ORGANISM=" , Strain NY0313808BC1" /LENGTH=181 /DNA_ID=CAMNT_0050649923 /DNA_START=426 /DNA_END=971 /DNA_ORIENTATION=+
MMITGEPSCAVPVGVKRASLIEKGLLRIVITDAPSNLTMEQFLHELISLKVKHVARACEPTYDTSALESAGIKVHDFQFKDGGPPSVEVRDQWLDLVESCFLGKQIADDEKISVHCIAGLGRAPVLVAIALIEFCGMEPVEAVDYIRTQRRGAINIKQLSYLEKYEPTRQHQSSLDCCIIS